MLWLIGVTSFALASYRYEAAKRKKLEASRTAAVVSPRIVPKPPMPKFIIQEPTGQVDLTGTGLVLTGGHIALPPEAPTSVAIVDNTGVVTNIQPGFSQIAPGITVPTISNNGIQPSSNPWAVGSGQKGDLRGVAPGSGLNGKFTAYIT